MTYIREPVSDTSASALARCREALSQSAALLEITGAAHTARRLSGLTNRVYKLETDRGDFVLRLPRAETSGMIDRAAEWENLQAAARLEITPAPLYGDPLTGILLLPWIEPAGTLSPDALGDLLARLHGSGAQFAFERKLGAYLGACEEQIAGEPRLQALADPLCRKVETLLERMPVGVIVPCHFDPSPGNVLVAQDRAYLIDFEYAAMAPAGWDLAYAALEHDLSEQGEAEMHAAYQGQALLPEQDEITLYKVVCDTVSMLWALGQHRAGSDADDFLSFAEVRRDRAFSLLQSLAQL